MQLAAPLTNVRRQPVNRLKPVHSASNTTWFVYPRLKAGDTAVASAAGAAERGYPTLPRFTGLKGRDGTDGTDWDGTYG